MRRHPRAAAWAAVMLAILAFVCLRASRAVAVAPEPVVVSAPLVSRPPVLDGQIDGMWFAIPSTRIPLWRGRASATAAYSVSLRAARTADSIFFLVTWLGQPPVTAAAGAGDDLVRNKLVVHFSMAAPWPEADKLMCLTACHTAYVNGEGRARYLVSETIPPGVTGALDVAGGWQGTRWVFEWSRPLVSGNPFDVQFTDQDGAYRFFIKVIDAVPGLADPVSEDLILRLGD